MVELEPEEVRVLGCLIEKEATTPETYPLTLNALRLACNQTSSRHPVVAYDDRTIEAALTSLRERGLTRIVHSVHNRATKYRHVLDEHLRLDRPGLALLAVLMLRGPQTVGELRARAERMSPFESAVDVERALHGLAGQEDPLVCVLPRQAGQKDVRWSHLLAGEPQLEAFEAPEERTPARTSTDDRLSALEAHVARLEMRMESLEGGT
jgi:uncharacterized protein YceH (UPF0502 family)